MSRDRFLTPSANRENEQPEMPMAEDELSEKLPTPPCISMEPSPLYSPTKPRLEDVINLETIIECTQTKEYEEIEYE